MVAAGRVTRTAPRLREMGRTRRRQMGRGAPFSGVASPVGVLDEAYSAQAFEAVAVEAEVGAR